MLTVKQAAAHACVCEAVVLSWIESGRLSTTRGHGQVMIQREDLEGVLASFAVGAPLARSAPKPSKAAACSSMPPDTSDTVRPSSTPLNQE